MLKDLRFAFRMLASRPWFSATVIVTLALSIGVNTTIFTLVNAVLFKPVPLPNGERMVVVSERLSSDPRDGSASRWRSFTTTARRLAPSTG